MTAKEALFFRMADVVAGARDALGRGLLSLDRHLVAAALLLRFQGATDSPRGLAAYGVSEVEEEDTSLDGGLFRMRSYRPRGRVRGAIVFVHGMHPGGIDEPRFARNARSFAAAGIATHTPDVAPLRRFELSHDVGWQVARAVERVSQASGHPVGIVGISFGGGVALRVAADPRIAPDVAYVFAIGAPHDLGRLGGWYAGEPTFGPEGERPHVTPHPYGAGIVARDDAEHFFSPHEVELGRSLLELALHDRGDEARSRARWELSEQARAIVEATVTGAIPPPLAKRLRESVRRHADRLASQSPTGRVRGVTCPVFLLHGRGDAIIPATESMHLAHELGPRARLLVTDVLGHADGETHPSIEERLRLVRLLARVLETAEAATSARGAPRRPLAG